MQGNVGSSSGTFKSSSSVQNPQYAVYGGGSSQDPSVSGESLTFDVPKEINVAVGNSLGSNFPAVANIQGNTASFHNVFGLLRVTFSGDNKPIKKIVLHDLAGNALWGTIKIPITDKLDYTAATVENNASGANTLTLNLSEATSLAGESVYFPVPAGALDDGFSIVLYDADGAAYSFLQKITGTMAMPRNGILTVSATVTDKHEAFNVNERGFYKSLFVNAGLYLSNYYKPLYTGISDNNYNNNGAANEGIQAITDLGLADDYEYFASHKTADYNGEEGILQSDRDLQNSILVQSDIDANGVLLYPDGSPRFRMVYVNGGQSKNHGPSLTYEGRTRFKTFFDNGGSYTASCAGSFLASKMVDDADQSQETGYTFGIFPGNLCHTKLPISINSYSNIYTNMEVYQNLGISQMDLLLTTDIEEIQQKYNNKLYPTDAEDVNYKGIKDVSHHGGSYLPTPDYNNGDIHKNDNIVGLQPLMKYRYSITTDNFLFGTENEDYYRINNFHTPSATHNNQTTDKNDRFWGTGTNGLPVSAPGNIHLISTWAYKPVGNATGRAVCTGSHPEYTNRESDKSFTKFMFQYALDGVGKARVKTSELTVGSAVHMGGEPQNYNKPEDNNAPIGDRQYHHFKFTTTGAENFVLRLESQYDKNSGIDLYLGLKKGGLAWLSDADYTLCNKGGQKELHIKHLPAGEWYVSVFCATTVNSEEKTDVFPKYFIYSGKTEVLNGIPYSIMINANGYNGTAGEKAPASNYGEGSSIGDDFTSPKFTPNFDN